MCEGLADLDLEANSFIVLSFCNFLVVLVYNFGMNKVYQSGF